MIKTTLPWNAGLCLGSSSEKQVTGNHTSICKVETSPHFCMKRAPCSMMARTKVFAWICSVLVKIWTLTDYRLRRDTKQKKFNWNINVANLGNVCYHQQKQPQWIMNNDWIITKHELSHILGAFTEAVSILNKNFIVKPKFVEPTSSGTITKGYLSSERKLKRHQSRKASFSGRTVLLFLSVW